MSSWHAGDIAIVDTPQGETWTEQTAGKRAQLVKFVGKLSKKYKTPYSDMWEITIDGEQWFASEIIFRKPYDGNELTTWIGVKAITGWTPKELVVTT